MKDQHTNTEVMFEKTEAGVGSNWTSWCNEYLIYAIKSNDYKEASKKLQNVPRDNDATLEELYKSNEEFEKILTKEFGKDSFKKTLVKAKSRGELHDATAELVDEFL